jgi:dTDP-4-dehydrorhamnose reductase
MDKLKVLVLGDGLLGSELIKQTGWDYISRKKNDFNANKPEFIIFGGYDKYNVIINCIANTDTYSNDKESHMNVNVKFVQKLVDYCNFYNIKLVHISTDYLYAGSVINASENDVPVHCNTWYGYSKLIGDGIVQMYSEKHLICRCMHKKSPFTYKNAWIDQIGNFDYVENIASIIIEMVNKNLSGLYNVGTDLKTMYQLAIKTNPEVNPVFSTDEVPKNISTNISKLNKDLGK